MGNRIPHRLANWFLLSLCVLMPALHAHWGRSWRPDSLQEIGKPLTYVEALAASLSLTHDATGYRAIFSIVLALPPDEATTFLLRYIDAYEEENPGATGFEWARAVFCLGVVHTEVAKQHLLRLWDHHDRRCADPEFTLTRTQLRREVPPLCVIADAIQFYFSDPAVRKWCLKRVAEADAIHVPSPNDWPRLSRREERRRLLFFLYHWDMIGAQDTARPLNERILRYYMFSDKKVENVDEAAMKAAEWIRRLPPIEESFTEESYLAYLGEARHHRLNYVCCLLDRPLGMALWRQFLRSVEPAAEKGPHTLRLWLTSLCCFASFKRGEGRWPPTDDELAYLKDALEFVREMRSGHVRETLIRWLYRISCFSSEALRKKGVLQDIRGFAHEVLENEALVHIEKDVEIHMSGAFPEIKFP